MPRSATICTGAAFGVDNEGTLQIRQPKPGTWPYETPMAEGNGLFEDEAQGLWVPPQERGSIRRDPDNYQMINKADETVGPKGSIALPADDIVISNPSAARMRVHLILHWRTYITLSDGTTNKSVGAIDVKKWYDTDPEPTVWEEMATAFSGSFTWRTSFVYDASTWCEPGQTRTIHSAIRYRNAEGSVAHSVRQLEMKPVGFTFCPFPAGDTIAYVPGRGEA